MNPTINRLKILFLALFAIGALAIGAYQIFYVLPAQKCDDRKGWFDPKTRGCGTVLYIPSITGRPAGMSRKDWSEQQAARAAQREREGYPTPDSSAPAPATLPVTPPAEK